MVLTKVIYKYLQTNRRITIPSLGTFLSKEGGEAILFSEFIKGDDGVLRELLSKEVGMSELQAAIFIDRFVFDLRHALESGESFAMPYLGYMQMGEGRIFQFEFDPSVAEPIAEETPAVEAAESERVEEAIEAVNDIVEAVVEQSEIEGSKRNDIESLYDSNTDNNAESETTSETQTDSTPTKRRVDLWIVAAIVVLILAIGLFCYGIMVEWIIGNFSFGADIDDSLEQFFSTDTGTWVEDMLTPKAPESSVGDVIPQDTIIIKAKQ